MLRTLIVEDEPLARSAVERLCQKNEQLEVVKVCENAQEALDFLKDNDVDLILLDVEMPGLSGIELLEKLVVMPKVILTTSKEEYAFDAFQYEVTDYLKKPFTVPRFNRAIEKALESETIDNRQSDFYFKESGRLTRLELNEINYIENFGDYVKINTENKTHVAYATMKSLENKLPKNLFLRVHRSFIVNLKKIVDIEQHSLLIGDKLIPISRASKPELLKLINIV